MNEKPRHRRGDALPRSLQPIGLSREVAAAFIDVSPSKFDEMVRDGRMPKPKQIDARRVWSRVAIERAFEALPGDEDEQEIEFEAWAAQPTKSPRPALAVQPAPESNDYWVKKPLPSKLSKLEMKALKAIYDDPAITRIHGVSYATINSLAERGFIVDDGKDHIELLELTPEGKAAYEASVNRPGHLVP